MSSDSLIYNGDLRDVSSLTISDLNRVVYYGDGCFETFLCYGSRFLHLDKHIARLNEAILYLGINIAPFTQEVVRRQIVELLSSKNLNEANSFVRIQVWRQGGRGYHVDQNEGAYIIEAREWTIPKYPVKLASVKVKAIPKAALSRKYKLSNSLNYIQASREARGKKADAALMFTVDDVISETEFANIFWYKDGIIYTPSVDCDLLPGITREIITSGSVSSFEIKEGRFNWNHLADAEAVWLTNSLREMIPVSSIDDITYDTKHTIITEMKQYFEAYKEKKLS